MQKGVTLPFSDRDYGVKVDRFIWSRLQKTAGGPSTSYPLKNGQGDLQWRMVHGLMATNKPPGSIHWGGMFYLYAA